VDNLVKFEVGGFDNSIMIFKGVNGDTCESKWFSDYDYRNTRIEYDPELKKAEAVIKELMEGVA
jgi:hypothetical protein